jgi:hypothetical protein
VRGLPKAWPSRWLLGKGHDGWAHLKAEVMDAAGLIDLRGLLHAWRARRFDGLIAVITFLATLGFAPTWRKAFSRV